MESNVDAAALPIAVGMELAVAILKRVAGVEVGSTANGETLTLAAMRMLIGRHIQTNLSEPNRI